MRRMLAVAAFAVGTVGSLGCAGNASYVRQNPDGSGGVIALKEGGDISDVQKLAAKHVGPDYELETIDPNFQPTAGTDPTAAKPAPGEMHYVYKKKARADLSAFPPASSGMPGTGAGTSTGMSTIGQASFQKPLPSGGVMPSAGTSGFGTAGGAAGGMTPPPVFPPQRLSR